MEMSAAKPIANAQNVMQLEHPKLGVIAYSADDIFFSTGTAWLRAPETLYFGRT